MSHAAAVRGEHRPFVVAHRGASADRPEHTLAAYELALREGADGVECDVRLTLDGHLVCVHDRRVDRTSTGTGLVSDMTLAELKQFDWGVWHGSRQPGSPQSISESVITRVESVASASRTMSNISFDFSITWVASAMSSTARQKP
jgi:glycerophosphoryl diester phosphodiesterase